MVKSKSDEILAYIKSDAPKENLELVKILWEDKRIRPSHRKELSKIILLSGDTSREGLLRIIEHLKRETLRPLEEGLECEGYTACIQRANYYERMKDIVKEYLKVE